MKVKFAFDQEKKEFRFNSIYTKIPFVLGGILPVGKHISDLINLDLFLNNIVIIRGCAFKYEDKTYCFIAPGFSGKTTLLSEYIKKGAQYICEDNLVVDYNNKQLYPSGNAKLAWYFSRKANRTLERLINNNFLKDKISFDELRLFYNSTDENYSSSPKSLYDFLNLNSLYFIDNLFIRTYLFGNDLYKKIDLAKEGVKQFENYNFTLIKNYKINELIK